MTAEPREARQVIARRKAGWWGAASLALSLAGLVLIIVGQYEWALFVFIVDYWPNKLSAEHKAWARGYSEGIAIGRRAAREEQLGVLRERLQRHINPN